MLPAEYFLFWTAKLESGSDFPKYSFTHSKIEYWDFWILKTNNSGKNSQT